MTLKKYAFAAGESTQALRHCVVETWFSFSHRGTVSRMTVLCMNQTILRTFTFGKCFGLHVCLCY